MGMTRRGLLQLLAAATVAVATSMPVLFGKETSDVSWEPTKGAFPLYLIVYSENASGRSKYREIVEIRSEDPVTFGPYPEATLITKIEIAAGQDVPWQGEPRMWANSGDSLTVEPCLDAIWRGPGRHLLVSETPKASREEIYFRER